MSPALSQWVPLRKCVAHDAPQPVRRGVVALPLSSCPDEALDAVQAPERVHDVLLDPDELRVLRAVDLDPVRDRLAARADADRELRRGEGAPGGLRHGEGPRFRAEAPLRY